MYTCTHEVIPLQFEQDLAERQVAHSSKAQKHFFFKGFAFIFYNSESSSPTKQLVIDIKTRSLRKEFVFLENFEFQAASQLKQGLCVIIASRTCFLLNLNEILQNEDEELKYKQFPLPARAKFDMSHIDVCFMANQLVVATYAKNSGVRIHRCGLNPVIECSQDVQPVEWHQLPVVKEMKSLTDFKSLEITETYESYKAIWFEHIIQNKFNI